MRVPARRSERLSKAHNWTGAQRAELIKDGRVKGVEAIEAHHMNTAKGNPIALAENPDNIEFLTKAEHADVHMANGGYHQPITGQALIPRAQMALDAEAAAAEAETSILSMRALSLLASVEEGME